MKVLPIQTLYTLYSHFAFYSQGFDKIGVYEGSFDDWNKNLGRVLKGEGFPIVGYEQVEAGLKDKSMLVIDVRKEEERKKMGYIPGTRNIERKI